MSTRWHPPGSKIVSCHFRWALLCSLLASNRCRTASRLRPLPPVYPSAHSHRGWQTEGLSPAAGPGRGPLSRVQTEVGQLYNPCHRQISSVQRCVSHPHISCHSKLLLMLQHPCTLELVHESCKVALTKHHVCFALLLLRQGRCNTRGAEQDAGQQPADGQLDSERPGTPDQSMRANVHNSYSRGPSSRPPLQTQAQEGRLQPSNSIPSISSFATRPPLSPASSMGSELRHV